MDNLDYTINGEQYQFDVAPYIDPDSGRAMAPIMFIGQALGADLDWDNDTETDTITLGGIVLKIEVNQPLPDDMGMAMMINDRLFVPLRYISEYLGARVDWEEESQAVTIIK